MKVNYVGSFAGAAGLYPKRSLRGAFHGRGRPAQRRPLSGSSTHNIGESQRDIGRSMGQDWISRRWARHTGNTPLARLDNLCDGRETTASPLHSPRIHATRPQGGQAGPLQLEFRPDGHHRHVTRRGSLLTESVRVAQHGDSIVREPPERCLAARRFWSVETVRSGGRGGLPLQPPFPDWNFCVMAFPCQRLSDAFRQRRLCFGRRFRIGGVVVGVSRHR